jgi:1,4-alpha-glucan branching enzyme
MSPEQGMNKTVLRRRRLDGVPKVRVTFAVPADHLGPVSLVGDFNRWDPTATPLLQQGAWLSATIDLDVDRTYAFRYRTEAGGWFNEESADKTEINEFGSENSVLDLRRSLNRSAP